MNTYKNTELIAIDSTNTFTRFNKKLSRFSGLATKSYMKKFGVEQVNTRENKFTFVEVAEVIRTSGKVQYGMEVNVILKSTHGEHVVATMDARDFIKETSHCINLDNTENPIYFSILFTKGVYEVTVYGSERYKNHLEQFTQQEFNKEQNNNYMNSLSANFDNEKYLQVGNRYLEIKQRTPFVDNHENTYLAIEHIYLGNGTFPIYENNDLRGFKIKGHRFIADIIHLVNVPESIVERGEDEIEYYVHHYINNISTSEILNDVEINSFSLVDILDRTNVKNIDTVSDIARDLLYGYNNFRNMDVYTRITKKELVKDISENKLILLEDKCNEEDIKNIINKVKSTLESIKDVLEFRELFYNLNYLKGNTFYLDRALSYIFFKLYIGWYMYYIVENFNSDRQYELIYKLIDHTTNNKRM